MKGYNINESDRSKWEHEVYIKLHEQNIEDTRIIKTTKMLEYICMIILTLGIVGIFLMNRANGYLF